MKSHRRWVSGANSVYHAKKLVSDSTAVQPTLIFKGYAADACFSRQIIGL